jgi:hypothetical protein
MAIPANKKELARAIETSWKKLQEDVEGITDKASRSKTMEGHVKGTKMSPHNLMAYLLGWSELVIRWTYGKEKDLPVDFPATGYKWNELGKLAQKFYKDNAAMSFFDLKHTLNRNVGMILNIVNAKTNAELYKMPWYETYTHGRMIQLNTSSPFKNASARIRKWKKSERQIS